MKARGQGTVELALGSFVFVTVLMLGIHLGEVGFLSLKVHEAADHALWDATGRRAHLFTEDNVRSGERRIYAPGENAAAAAGPRATARYRDFEGLSSRQGSGGITQALTGSGPISVDCDQQPALAFEVPEQVTSTEPVYLQQVASVRDLYRGREGGLSCRASATLGIIRVPRRFLQNNERGMAQVEHWQRALIPVCAAGRAEGSSCRGRFGVLLGDWGLEHVV